MDSYPASTFSTVSAAHITKDALVWSFTKTGTTGSFRFSMSMGGDDLEDVATAVSVLPGGGYEAGGVGDAYYIVGNTNTGEQHNRPAHTFSSGGDAFSWTTTASGHANDIFVLRVWQNATYPLPRFDVASRVVKFPTSETIIVSPTETIYRYSNDFPTDVDVISGEVRIAGYGQMLNYEDTPNFFHSGLARNIVLSKNAGFVMEVDRGVTFSNRLGDLHNGTYAYFAMDYGNNSNQTKISAMARDSYGRWLFVGNGEGIDNFLDWQNYGIFTEDLFQPDKIGIWGLDGVIFRTDYPYEVSARQAEIIADDLPPTGDKLAVDQPISVDLYPNPAADHLTISMDGGVREDLGYAVVDMAGKVLLSGTLSSPQLMLPVGHLPTGAYLPVLTRATGATVSMSWIKQ
jgi:hypothetical protein